MLDRDRLVSILGLLGSDNLHERASAAEKADERDASKTWDDVILPPAYEERLNLSFELTERGWPRFAAAGIASELNIPMNGAQPNLAGWSDGRWSQLLDFCSRSNNADYSSTKSQLDYLTHSLRGPYQGLGAKIAAAKTAAEAAKLFRPYLGGDTEELT